MCICSQSFQSCPTLCNPGDCSPPGSSVHRIGQQEYWSGLAAISSSRGSSRPRDQTCISCASCIADGFFTAEPRERGPWDNIKVQSDKSIVCGVRSGCGRESRVISEFPRHSPLLMLQISPFSLPPP